jgi:hypothetical protein
MTAHSQKDDKSGNVDCKLIFRSEAFSSRENIPGYLRITNNSDQNIVFLRPAKGDINFTVENTEHKNYKIELQNEDGIPENREMLIKPVTAVEIYIGNILIKNPLNGDLPVPNGAYSVKLIWKNHGIKQSASGVISVQASINLIEYPLSIILNTTNQIYKLGEKIYLDASIRNEGNDIIQLYNLYYPYHDYFNLNIKCVKSIQKNTNDVSEDIIPPIAKFVSPDKSEAWLTLLPKESVSVLIDISDKVHQSGIHEISIEYKKAVLLFNDTGKPYYSEKKNWRSNQISIMIIN